VYAHIHKCTAARQNEATPQEETINSKKKGDASELKLQILKSALTFVPEYGWSEKSIALGAKSAGLSLAAHTLIQGGGPELVHYFNFSCNSKLEEYLKAISSSNEKLDLHVYMTDALENRLKMIIPYVSTWSEAMALMALPTQFPVHTKNILDLVDSIWHYYGDKSLDMSWYSKRIMLAIAYKTSELSLIQDRSEDFIDTFEFLQRRVENVIEADSVVNSINENSKHLKEFGDGAFITVRNLLGLNRWSR